LKADVYRRAFLDVVGTEEIARYPWVGFNPCVGFNNGWRRRKRHAASNGLIGIGTSAPNSFTAVDSGSSLQGNSTSHPSVMS
jgi:hypothetical protein